MGAVRTEVSLTKTSVHHSEDSATCAVPCLATKGHILSQPLQLLPHDMLSSPGEEMNMFSCGSIQSIKSSYGKNTNRTD